MSRKVMTVRELEVQPPRNVMLRCGFCEANFSATRGDYFMLGLDAELRCTCGEPLRRVKCVTKYHAYSPRPA